MKYAQLVICLILGLGLWAQENGEVTIPLSSPDKIGSLIVELHSGPITLTGTNRKDVLIKYQRLESKTHKHKGKEKETDKTKSSAVEGLKKVGGSALDLEISEHQNKIHIESSSWNVPTSLTIEVPVKFNVSIEAYNHGTVEVANVDGELEIQSYNGPINAENISGSLIANTYNGSITASFNSVLPNSPMSFATYNGKIDLTLPPSIKASFKMKTSNGDIYTDYDMKIDPIKPETKKDAKAGVYKVSIGDWQKGSINGGGPEITLENYHGNIYIRKGA